MRDLDGMYFRIERDGKWMSVCFTDLTPDEMCKVVTKLPDSAVEQAVEHLQEVLPKIIHDDEPRVHAVLLGQAIQILAQAFDVWGEEDE